MPLLTGCGLYRKDKYVDCQWLVLKSSRDSARVRTLALSYTKQRSDLEDT